MPSSPRYAPHSHAATATSTASAGAAALVSGRVTSCYGSRWGTNHNGIDIAAPIGTTISAPESGVVLQAGPANGFGLAVYILGDDGAEAGRKTFSRPRSSPVTTIISAPPW